MYSTPSLNQDVQLHFDYLCCKDLGEWLKKVSKFSNWLSEPFVKPKRIMVEIDYGLPFNGFDIFVWIANFLCDKY